MRNECRLTTIDNPYDPFDDFDAWYRFDMERYNSCAYLAQIAQTSSQLSQEENDEEVERAIDEILKFDFMHIYRKVKRKVAYP